MSSADWYTNSEWNDAIEKAFRSRLSRSRSQRPHYLRVQAGQLADRHPTVALGLIAEYFETGDEFEVPLALSIQARAYGALGQKDEAVAAFRAALAWEDAHPYLVSPARLEYPKYVATARVTSEYQNALHILSERFQAGDHVFPAYSYVWNGANALIAYDLGMSEAAKEFADRALRVAALTESPFRRHPSIGLVERTSDEFGRRIKKIALRPRWKRFLDQLRGLEGRKEP
jgi:tetratricopeptide (TPR) repeat protein